MSGGPTTEVIHLELNQPPVFPVILKSYHELASIPGAEEGEEKERLVHTVCACT